MFVTPNLLMKPSDELETKYQLHNEILTKSQVDQVLLTFEVLNRRYDKKV